MPFSPRQRRLLDVFCCQEQLYIIWNLLLRHSVMTGACTDNKAHFSSAYVCNIAIEIQIWRSHSQHELPPKTASALQKRPVCKKRAGPFWWHHMSTYSPFQLFVTNGRSSQCVFPSPVESRERIIEWRGKTKKRRKRRLLHLLQASWRWIKLLALVQCAIYSS